MKTIRLALNGHGLTYGPGTSGEFALNVEVDDETAARWEQARLDFNQARLISRRAYAQADRRHKAKLRALDAAREYYAQPGPVVDCLHIALDDGNLEDADIQFCLDRARQGRDYKGVRLAQLLSLMTLEERVWLYENLRRPEAQEG